jgi:hypothetical protein
MGSLSLYLKAGDKLGLLWKFSEEAGDIWNGAESVTIPNYSNYENFTFIFEGMVKSKNIFWIKLGKIIYKLTFRTSR